MGVYVYCQFGADLLTPHPSSLSLLKVRGDMQLYSNEAECSTKLGFTPCCCPGYARDPNPLGNRDKHSGTKADLGPCPGQDPDETRLTE